MDGILRQALNNRAKSVTLLHPESSPRPLMQGQPTSHKYIDVGIIFDPEHAFRMIDRGPKVDDDPSVLAAFRAFWGEKSDLRRFADGAIQECVAWETNSAHERAHIPVRIVQHILQRHFNLKKVHSFSSSYDETIMIPTFAQRSLSRSSPASSQSSGGYRAAMQAFDELVKTIKAMELPLSLVAALPCAEGLRYTSILPPLPIPPSKFSASSVFGCASYVEAYDVVLQFEKSAKWPDDLGAIQKLKLAWYEQLGKALMDSIKDATTTVALDALATPIEDSASLEVMLPLDFAFRLRMYHDRERTLLEQILADKSITSTSSSYERLTAQRALKLHLSRFIFSPQHHASVMNMHHQYVGYSSTVRLVKRWFSSHMLSPYIPPELIELLCAFVFLRPDSQVVPSTGSTGFARALAFLKDWDWRTEPLLVPIHAATNSDSINTENGHGDPSVGGRKSVPFPIEKRSKAEKAFNERRSTDPGMSRGGWHIATDHDIEEGYKEGATNGIEGVYWCLDGKGPSPMIADRIKELAKASWTYIDQGMENGSLRAKVWGFCRFYLLIPCLLVSSFYYYFWDF
jgi:U3 small nucleolar RNA-associated protein 22